MKRWLKVFWHFLAAAQFFAVFGYWQAASAYDGLAPGPAQMGAGNSQSPLGQIILAAGGYVGPQSCRDCHPAQFELWANSGHASAERLISTNLERSAFDPARAVAHASQTSHVGVQNGQYQINTLGFQSNVAPYRVERVIGWKPIRQFMTQAQGGRWQVHELAFDTARKDWFDVYGEEDRRPGEWGHWTGGGMNWNSRCAACHNTRVAKNYDERTDSYQTTMAEMGVGCEACHGPLKNHVDWRSSHTNSAQIEPNAPLVQRSKILDACGSCHARLEELTGQFQPGDSLYDHYSLEILDESGHWYPDGQVKDEDYEFASFLGCRMFAGGVHCRDCHRSDSGTGNDLCMRCHRGGNADFTNAPVIAPNEHAHHKLQSKGAECIGCHMPTTVYMQRHSRHDHGFVSPDPLLTKQLGIPNACNRCHSDKSLDWALEYAEKWYGAKMQSHARERTGWISAALNGDDSAKEHLVSMVIGDREQAYWRAVAANLLWQWGGEAKVKAALIRALQDKHPLVREKAVLALESEAESGDEQSVTAVKAALNDGSRSVRVAAAWALKGTIDLQSKAGQELARSLDYNVDQPKGLYRKAMFFLSRQQQADALNCLQRAIKMDPFSPPLRYQTAMVLERLGRRTEALEMLVAGERAVPTDPKLPYARATLLARSGQTEEARTAANQALRIQPDFQPAKDLLEQIKERP